MEKKQGSLNKIDDGFETKNQIRRVLFSKMKEIPDAFIYEYRNMAKKQSYI